MTKKIVLTREQEEKIWGEVISERDIYTVEFKDGKTRFIFNDLEEINRAVDIIKEAINMDKEKELTIEDIAEALGIDDTICFWEEVAYCGCCGKYEFIDNMEFIGEYGIVICEDCLKENIKDYIDEFVNNPNKALRFKPDLEGWEEADHEWEAGLYDRYDEPSKVLDYLHEYYQEVVFFTSYSNPFMTTYKAMVRNEEDYQY